MKKTLLSAILLVAFSVCGFAQTFDNIPTGEGFYINKLIISPSGFDQTKELIEIRGEANAVIPSDLWLVAVEGDGNSSNAGRLSEEIQLGDGTRTFGANGIFAIVTNYIDDNTAVVTTNAYDGLINPDATVFEVNVTGVDVMSSSSGDVTGFSPDIGYDGNFSDQTGTYMLIQASEDPDGVRIDGDGDTVAPDGEIDDTGVHTTWVLYDSITYMDDNDEGAGEFGYGQIVIAQNQSTAGANQFITPSATVFNFSDPVDSDSDVNIMIRQGERTGFTTDDWAFAASSNNDDFPNWTFSTTENKVFPVEANGWDGLNTVYGALNPEFTNLSTDEFNANTVSIYPNPASSTLFFETSDNRELSIEMFDVNGKKIKEEVISGSSTDISHLSKGVYFVSIQSNNTVTTQKFIKL